MILIINLHCTEISLVGRGQSLSLKAATQGLSVRPPLTLNAHQAAAGSTRGGHVRIPIRSTSLEQIVRVRPGCGLRVLGWTWDIGGRVLGGCVPWVLFGVPEEARKHLRSLDAPFRKTR